MTFSTSVSTSAQDSAYPEGFDYVQGSPHLKHLALKARIDGSLIDEVARTRMRTGHCRTLEVGAGHGSFTAVLRGAGADVTVTEMSSSSAARLRTRFDKDPSVTVVHDGDGSWVFETGSRFDLVVAVSVLHHIPDYLAAVARYADVTEPGGSFISWQDPMWYPRQPRAVLAASRVAYFAWRIRQGNLKRGIATRMRRLSGTLDEGNVSDMAEYHVVRKGVDESALARLLRDRYAETLLIGYWSTQSTTLQRAGNWLRLRDTFGFVARDRLTNRPSESAGTDYLGKPDRSDSWMAIESA